MVELTEYVLENETARLALIGAVTYIIVAIAKWVAKLAGRPVTSEDRLRTSAGAFATALVVTLLEQVFLAPDGEPAAWGMVVVRVLVAWWSAQGIHSTSKRAAELTEGTI